ncbi:E3 SUMO-protein ligase PIAS4b isoform X2 [Danio rerio]
MLETLRVTELRLLLSKMGKSKSGLKKDLQKRVTDLLHNDCSPELLSAVRELHDLRQISKSRRSGIEIISMPESLSPGGTPSPKSAGPQMIKLPFYQTLETIIPPTPLVPTYGGAMQNSDFLFHLSESQQALIQNSRSSQPVQVVLRICYSESIGVEEDQYPPNICVSVNHNNCPVQSYSVAVYLVRLVSCQQLLDQLRSSSVEQEDVCRLRVSEKLRSDPETEVATTGLQVSLICPLVKLRMSVPCRSRGCAHLQCFDASFYLQMNEKKPRWSCPVCHRYAPFDELRIDSLLRDVLESSGEDVEEIEYLSDSTWKAVKHDKSDQNKGSARHPVKHNVNSKPVRDAVVDLTQSSSDDEDFQKEETVSTHIEDKSVHFRKSGIVKSARHKGRKTQVHTEKHRNGN